MTFVNQLKRTIILFGLELSYATLRRIAMFDLQHEESHLVNKIENLTLRSRADYILERCKGKRVLHLGCAAAPFTENRLKEGTLLHQKLFGVSSSLVGVDNSDKGVSLLKKELGAEEIYLLNVYDLDSLRHMEKFDVIVAGEIIEHLENPGIMLRGARKLLKEGGVLVATVPNAFKCRNFFAAQQGLEVVHREHVAWYSYQTVRRLFAMSGYTEINISGYVNADHWIGRRFVRRSSLFCDGLIVDAGI